MNLAFAQSFRPGWWRYPPLASALAAGLIAGTAFVLGHLEYIDQRIETVLYWLAIPLGGWHWIREGIEKLVEEREVSIEILMIAATAGSGMLGLWDEAAALVVLYGAAEGTEQYTHERTRHAIRALLDLVPKQARVLRNGEETMVLAEHLRPGDVFSVRPGESIATDGVIVSGQSSVDESPVTGESMPVDKSPGMAVYAASINRQGALEIRAMTAFSDNTLSKIIHLVEQAQERKGRAQQWIERFGRRYSPAVLAASALLVVVPALLGLAMGEWASRAVVLLVAAAPCALIMSTPIATAAAIGSAGRQGILIKGGAHLEHLGRIRAVAFDKTGTLTVGKPQVTDTIALYGSQAELLAVAAALEQLSEHPLARAIVDYARTSSVAVPSVEAFEALLGAGAKGTVDGQTWHIGSPRLFEHLGAPTSGAAPRIASLQDEGKTVVLVGDTKSVRGIIALRDRPREGARMLIRRLHERGLRIAMLTGDNLRAAQAIGQELGIDHIRAELKPDEKVRAIHDLTMQHGPILMVGDGINDAPALAAASCGVAMGAAGSDAAIEAADVALMADDLTKLEAALDFARQSRRISTQNIAFSILVLTALIPAALAGWMSVALAVVVHETSELLAVLNGLRAGQQKSVAAGG